MARKKLKVTSESQTGRNLDFHDNYNNANMTRAKLVQRIEGGGYPKYHVRVINGIKTPVSNPDKTTDNNLD